MDALDVVYEKEVASRDEPDRYPLIIRIYGVLSMIGGGLQVALFVLVLIAIIRGRIDLSTFEGTNTVTAVIALIALVLSVILAGMFFVLGVRLVRGKRRMAALLAIIMIAVEAAVLVCQFLLTGISVDLIPPAINVAILVALQTYSDPALRDERRLQRKLRQLEVKSQAEDGTLGLDTTGKGFITLNFYNVFWVFVICSIIGLIIEIVYHMVVVEPGVYQDRAGLLFGPFSPIYGVGAVLMTVALNRFHDKNFIIIFLVSAVIGGAFEFFVSWFMEMAFGITAWDYTGTFLSIGGRTNGMFMAMWGGLGLVWIKLCLPAMLKIVNKIPWNWRYSVTVVCAVAMLVDCTLTLAAYDCWYQREAGTMDYANQSAIVQFCNDNYGNDFMQSRFQSMTMNTDSAARVN